MEKLKKDNFMNEELYKLLWQMEKVADSVYRPLVDLSMDYKCDNAIELDIDDEINRAKILISLLEQLKTMLTF